MKPFVKRIGSIAIAGIILNAVMSMTYHDLSAAESKSLEVRLKPLIDAHRGRVAVAVKHLANGEGFAWQEREVMPTASLIKFPVLIELYRQAEAGEVDLQKRLTFTESDQSPGSGVLTPHFSPGATLTVRDAARLMIAFSDNSATNLVLDQIGLAATAKTMAELGCPNTRLHHKVFRRETTSIAPDRSRQFGLGSTTAEEMIRLLELLEAKKLVSLSASQTMLEHLKACEDRDKLTRFLPEGTVAAFKTGSLDEVRTMAGILYTPAGPVAVCVLTAENEDQRWVPDNAGNRLCAEVGREVFEHFRAAR